MIPVQQTKRGGPTVPPEERGDCVAACIASLLEVPIEEVPIDMGADDWWQSVQDAVEPHGYSFIEFGNCLPSSYWIASVPSLNLGYNEDGTPVKHVIVMKNDEVAHDPALGNRYPVGRKIVDLHLFCGYALTPLNPVSLQSR